QLASYFASHLAGALRSREDEQPLFSAESWDVVVGLPSAAARAAARGYSPVALVARKTARLLGIPYSGTALTSVGARAPQVSLTTLERVRNCRGAFRAVPRLVNNKQILLIDDVVTTASSITGATEAMLEQGAVAVDVLTIARSRRFHAHRLTAAETDSHSSPLAIHGREMKQKSANGES
ncbi:MAG: ComF family protein, partial [Bdellovibrionales bacterium]|nr:ComF family protein [Bdellovibrionales bacterium]